MQKKDFIIIGAGLGGLLSATVLSKKGYKGVILEKQTHVGGRFTSHNYKGFEVPTGALHMIPHGKSGPLGRFLRKNLPDLKIMESIPKYGIVHKPEKDIHLKRWWHPVQKVAPRFEDKLGSIFLFKDMMYPPGTSGEEWIVNRIKAEDVHKWFSACSIFTMSMEHSILEAREMLALVRAMVKYGGPGVPKGGCKAVTEGLAKKAKSKGTKIITGAAVKKILVDGGKAVGVVYSKGGEEKEMYGKIVINNAGPKVLMSFVSRGNLDKEFIKKVNETKPVCGITTVISAKKPLLGHTSISWFLDHNRVGGIVEPTNIDPSLAPKGKHLVLTHQVLKSKNMKKEIEKGEEEIKSFFPNFDKNAKILMSKFYGKTNPVNWSPQGDEFHWKTPIENLYMVGDAVKQHGYIMAEGVAKGVLRAVPDMVKGLKAQKKEG